MKVIPLQSVPSQTVSIVLGSQSCRISVYQKTTGVFFSLSVNDVPIVTGRICRNLVKIVRHEYLGFSGDLAFVDTQGLSDPQYEGIGNRYILGYFE